jgi:uncharacterized protein
MTTAVSTDAVQNFNWLMTSFAERVDGVDVALAVSSDGLLMAASRVIDRATADRVSAIITGIRSLGDGAARALDAGALNQVIVEMDSVYLFVSSVSGGATLGTIARKSADLGLVGYEMTLLVQRVGAQLTPELITELKNGLEF